MLHVVDGCVKKRTRAQLCPFIGDLTKKGFVHVTISAKFPPLVGDFLAMILMGSDRRNKKESIGIFFVFLAIFSGMRQSFGV
jgi:hypothetical protein